MDPGGIHQNARAFRPLELILRVKKAGREVKANEKGRPE
jgi:hypothetical protein